MGKRRAGETFKIVLHRVHTHFPGRVSSLQLRARNILVVRERAALGVFCIIYVSAVHAHEGAPAASSLTWLTQITLIPLGALSYFMESRATRLFSIGRTHGTPLCSRQKLSSACLRDMTRYVDTIAVRSPFRTRSAT